MPPPKTVQTLICIVLSIATGLIAWDYYLPVAILIPVLWSNANNKMTATLIGLSYHLAASRGLIMGIPVFFDSSFIYGLFLWTIAGLIQSLPYFLCSYVRNPYIAVALLLVALIIPPIGIVGWANPITAAGVIFPGTGFAGIVLTLCLIWVMIWLYKENKAFVLCWVVFLFVFPLTIESNIRDDLKIVGSTTNFKGNPSNLGEKFSQDYQKFIKIFNQYKGTDFKTLVLPESTTGIWFESSKHLWSRWQKKLKKDQSIILSALVPDGDKGLNTYNALIEMKKDSFREIYRARQSVPVAMWKPWGTENVKNNWFDSPLFEISDKKATALICYEAYLTWPILQSFLSGDPEAIIFVSNHWWSKNTSLLSIQKSCVNAWVCLFDVQLITAVNL